MMISSEIVFLYVTFGATQKTGQKTSPPWRMDLFISETLTLYMPIKILVHHHGIGKIVQGIVAKNGYVDLPL